ncbi:MAG: hypothetical protein U1E23_14905 [Reyranellaceae bacterium]
MSAAVMLCPSALLEELVAALRRHDASETRYWIAQWSATDRREAWGERATGRPRQSMPPFGECCDLTEWLILECSHFTGEGRFEHALCLIERYRHPPDDKDPT